jgi:hypothetical protein
MIFETKNSSLSMDNSNQSQSQELIIFIKKTQFLFRDELNSYSTF